MIRKKYAFYVPHEPVDFDNLVLDPKSGELKPMPSMARQEFRDQCDINNILKQFKKTGIISHISAHQAQGSYEDLPDPMEYQDALNAVMAAQESFATLPSKVRSRFENDPQAFLAFMADPNNAEEIYELGLATRPSDPGSNQPAAQSAASSAEGTSSTNSTPTKV